MAATTKVTTNRTDGAMAFAVRMRRQVLLIG
jgi:hypothetical protein